MLEILLLWHRKRLRGQGRHPQRDGHCANTINFQPAGAYEFSPHFHKPAAVLNETDIVPTRSTSSPLGPTSSLHTSTSPTRPELPRVNLPWCPVVPKPTLVARLSLLPLASRAADGAIVVSCSIRAASIGDGSQSPVAKLSLLPLSRGLQMEPSL